MGADRREDASSLELDDTLAMLLQRAARVSTPIAEGLGSRLHVGATLRDGRLRVLRTLGEGGMGLVFEVFDAERGAPVALKTLTHLHPEGVYRFKNEFRALADVSHRNLCRLYELFSEAGAFFFTMELVAGERFDRWVRPNGALDEPRLRAALPQLCEAIGAIHDAGWLHRDLKPSNVLVTAEGRVVVLDFGLVTDREQGGVGETLTGGRVSGTPSYMAPEQVAAGPATTASDLYALGVMLFEALTGSLPFEGSVARIFVDKLQKDAPSARALGSDTARDLEGLCAELLAREQARRPSIEQVLERVGRTDTPSPVRQTHAPASTHRLVGRESELRALHAAYDTAAAGRAVVLLVTGESGMGKSALVAAFLEQQRARGEAVILSGRCNEREDVPFKAFDALVDNLSRYLRKLSREETLAQLPREVYALARLFPVLGRVELVAEAPSKAISDAPELRRRAFAAFGELIGRIRDRRPLCVFIDDLQWVDADSVLFMRALLVDRDPAPLLLVLSHRSEGAEHSESLLAIAEVAEANAAVSVQRLSVKPLDESAARALALQSLHEAPADRDALALSIVRESGGSPFFVRALAQHVLRSGEALAGLSLAQVLGTRLRELEPHARRLLEVSALAGQPLSLDLLLAATGASHDALDDLRGQHLVRIGAGERGKTLECFHDRIRETVVGELSDDERAERYRALAGKLALDAHAEPELLSTCFEGAGELSEAARFAALAAERAERGMAFDRAAKLYQRALALGSPEALDRHGHLIAWAEALGNAGRAKEAAQAYLQAAAGVSGTQASDLRRCAAQELMQGGFATEGEALMRKVFADVSVKIPETHAKAMLDYALMQARVRWAGLPAPSSGASLSPRQRLLLDVGRTGTYLAVGDPIFSVWAGTKYVLLASAARDPSHVAWSLALEAYNFTVLSPKSEKRISQIFATATAHAKLAPGNPELEGVIAMCDGVGFAFGRAMTAEVGRQKLLHANEVLTGRRGLRFFLDVTNLYLMRSPSQDLSSEARKFAGQVEEAFSLGRPWTGGHMAAMSTAVRLLVDDVAGVVRHLEQAARSWQPQAAMQWMDLTSFEAFGYVAYYQGDPQQVLERAERLWPFYERSAVRRSAIGAALMHAHRGTAALWVSRSPGTSDARRRALLELARADCKQLEQASFHPYPGLVLALRAGLALAAGDRRAAIDVLRNYILRGPHSPFLAGSEVLAARRLLGDMLGGDEGQVMCRSADAALRAMGVVDLQRSTQMLLPGCAK